MMKEYSMNEEGQVIVEEKHPVALSPIYPHYHLISKLETLKANWYLWLCDREDENGNMTRGTIETDLIGCVAAFETFKPIEE